MHLHVHVCAMYLQGWAFQTLLMTFHAFMGWHCLAKPACMRTTCICCSWHTLPPSLLPSVLSGIIWLHYPMHWYAVFWLPEYCYKMPVHIWTWTWTCTKYRTHVGLASTVSVFLSCNLIGWHYEYTNYGMLTLTCVSNHVHPVAATPTRSPDLWLLFWLAAWLQCLHDCSNFGKYLCVHL